MALRRTFEMDLRKKVRVGGTKSATKEHREARCGRKVHEQGEPRNLLPNRVGQSHGHLRGRSFNLQVCRRAGDA